jgi:hypothetical protein
MRVDLEWRRILGRAEEEGKEEKADKESRNRESRKGRDWNEE